jgi:hypothetical protein
MIPPNFKDLISKVPVGVAVAGLYIFAAWSLGALPVDAFGEGFARAEAAKFNTQLLLEQRLSSVKQRQCAAKDSDTKTYWVGELIRLKNLYREKLGIDYYEPPCDAVLVTHE